MLVGFDFEPWILDQWIHFSVMAWVLLNRFQVDAAQQGFSGFSFDSFSKRSNLGVGTLIFWKDRRELGKVQFLGLFTALRWTFPPSRYARLDSQREAGIGPSKKFGRLVPQQLERFLGHLGLCRVLFRHYNKRNQWTSWLAGYISFPKYVCRSL